MVQFLASGDTALVVEFCDRIDRALSEQVLRLNAKIHAARITGVVETVPTFRSLMVHYDPLRTDAAALTRAIEGLLHRESTFARKARLWRVPVCYEGEHAPDMAYVMERTGLTRDKVVALHSGVRYHIYMIGFLPGFPYMGDLPELLRLPRRTDPRVQVPAGSVAIAATMTGIYPLESPGGWHLIGSTPIRLFDLGRVEMVLFAPGDAVLFEPVGSEAFQRIRSAVEGGEYRVSAERIA